jgi:pyruvate dehydrogenase E2 component (dihydrolipoamide acetyltransferase)
MAEDVKLPEIGEGVESGDVLEVYVSEGDTIEQDQDIMEIEADKGTLGVPSNKGGKVSKVHVKKGDTVSVGDVLISLESDDDSGGKEKSKKEESKKEEEPEQDSAEEDSDEEEDQAADESEQDDQDEDDQDADEAEDQREEKEQPKKKESPTKPAAEKKSKPAPKESAEDYYDASDAAVPAGPSVRRFAREVGVDLRGVKGSGEHGRISRDDVLNVVRSSGRGSSAASAQMGSPSKAKPTPPVEKLPPPGDESSDKWGPVRVEKLSRIRKTIATKMHESWETCPRVTNFDDADVTALEKIRQASKADYAAAGIKLTAMPFLIKAVAMALRTNPAINASIDLENERIVYKEYVNIGIAVDSPRGLVVPSLRSAHAKSISDVARDLAELADSVRDGTFKMEDLQGSTFTISNLGAIGGTYSTPIINIPEVAILLIGRSRKMPVVVNNEIAVRLMMPLSLSYDHRLVDGATAARFLNDVKAYLEEPSRLLLAP